LGIILSLFKLQFKGSILIGYYFKVIKKSNKY